MRSTSSSVVLRCGSCGEYCVKALTEDSSS